MQNILYERFESELKLKVKALKEWFLERIKSL